MRSSTTGKGRDLVQAWFNRTLFFGLDRFLTRSNFSGCLGQLSGVVWFNRTGSSRASKHMQNRLPGRGNMRGQERETVKCAAAAWYAFSKRPFRGGLRELLEQGRTHAEKICMHVTARVSLRLTSIAQCIWKKMPCEITAHPKKSLQQAWQMRYVFCIGA
jgi:hypothetical protein